MFVRRQLSAVRDRSAKLIEDLERLGLESELGKAMFLHACALKEEGSATALDVFENLLTKPEVARDALLCGLSLMHMGDLQGSCGQLEAATDSFRRALPLLEESGVPWALADFDAVVAEKFRDEGCLSAAIDRYRSAIKKYSDKGFSVRESYLRVLLSETLIADGRQGEAAAELVAALPAIERESLRQESIAAIALLREALKRSRPDYEALSTLRVLLERPKKEGL